MGLPLKLYQTKLSKAGRQTVRVKAYAEVADMSKTNRYWKGLAPNSEILYPLRLLASFRFGPGGNLQIEEIGDKVSLEEYYAGRGKLTLTGILRAMMALRAKYPEAYDFFIRFAQLFSVQVDSRVKVAPMQYLYYRTVDHFVRAWSMVEEEFGFTAKEFARELARWAKENPDIFENVALFSPKPEVDAEQLEKALRGELEGNTDVAQVVKDTGPTVVVRADVLRIIFGGDKKEKDGRKGDTAKGEK